MPNYERKEITNNYLGKCLEIWCLGTGKPIFKELSEPQPKLKNIIIFQTYNLDFPIKEMANF